VARIFVAKERPATDPVIVHLADVEQVVLVARSIPDAARLLAREFWPGPLTMILEKTPGVSDAITAGLATVAVRVPAHPVAHALIQAARVPVVAPSANRFSRPSPTEAAHVLADLEGRIDLVVDGGMTTIGVESTIVDLTTTPPIVRRPGGVTTQRIGEVIGEVRTVAQLLAPDAAQPAPGQLLRHYSPRAPTTLYVGDLPAVTTRVGNDVRNAVAAGSRVGVLAPEEDLVALAPRLAAVGSGGRVVTRRCGSRRDRAVAAHELFRALRQLDDEGVEEIYAIAPPGDGIDEAILDRLTRAAEGRIIHT
jgi:L-threonylcarbamoyladenylate synthase